MLQSIPAFLQLITSHHETHSDTAVNADQSSRSIKKL